MFTTQSVHISFEIWGSIFCIIAAICLFLSKIFEKKKRILLTAMQLSGAILLGMDAVAWMMRGADGTVGYYGVRISNFMVFVITDVIMMLFHSYVLLHIRTEKEGEGFPVIRQWMVYIVGGIGIFFIILTQFNQMYYYFDADNYYHRNTLYPISVGIGLLGLLIDVSILIQFRKRIAKNVRIAMFSYIVLPIVGSVLLVFYYGISFANIAITITMIFVFVTEILEQNRILLQKEKELYDMKVNLMLSQIGPHFIYNTLNTIGLLCRKDPAEAETTVNQFSRYLRSNLNSLSSPELIPFEQELEHTKTYVAIEQKRFAEKVCVEYDTQETKFMIPALSLQPLVENAIRYGVRRKKEGGTVRIRTTTERDRYVVTIQDDGAGFDVTTLPDDGKEHIGIWNVKNRLRSMCNGDLQIESTPGVGTTVVLTIPRAQEE